MGQIRFLASRRDRVPPGAVERAYLAGLEGVVWSCNNRWVGDQIVVQRKVSESGNLYIPWQVEGHGQLVLSTASLMEREAPYHLEVELARGTLNRVRNQLAAWQSAGLDLSDALSARIDDATEKFSRTLALQDDAQRAAEEAEDVLRETLDSLDILVDDFTQQVLSIRHRQTPKLATLLACALEVEHLRDEESQAFLPAFNSVMVPFNWRRIEATEGERDWIAVDHLIQWCRNNELKVCGGPLLRLDRDNLPDWLYLWEDSFDDLQSYAVGFVESAVQRYRGSVDIWHCASAVNMDGAFALSEEQRLRLSVAAIDAVRRADPKTPVIVSFDQPWGDFLSTQNVDLTPLHFADALVRADLGLAGVAMEINLGYWPGGTLPRDLLEFSRQIDRWGLLGLPLIIMLTIPSRSDEDPLAQNAAKPLAGVVPEGISPEAQRKLVERLVPFLVAKQAVHGVIWGQFRDAIAHPLAHGGLFDAQQCAKPVLETLATFRQEHLL